MVYLGEKRIDQNGDGPGASSAEKGRHQFDPIARRDEDPVARSYPSS